MNVLYQLSDLGFAYNADFCLSNINLDIETSAVTAIVGPNGSGKTTLLNILAFLELPTGGVFKYDSNIVSKVNIAQLKKTVGYVQQNPYLLRGSVYKNIELGLKLQHVDKEKRDKTVNKVMNLLNITQLAERSARTLSGGEAQKVAIGQALALEPQVLILDEPFTYLDKYSINELEQLILKLKRDHAKTIIFTTHNQLQAQWLADHVYSVIKGQSFESELINLFSGKLDIKENYFDTGKQIIIVPEGITHAEHVAIDPKQIVLSGQKLDSSMQNSFQGKITGMVEQNGQVKIEINAGENFHAIITHKAMEEMRLSIGGEIWVSFKSSAVLIF